MPIDHYYVPFSAPCRAVVFTADLLGVELNNKFLNLMEGEQNKPEFLKINPQHCVPTIVDDGFALWESRAIITYLVNKYAPGHDLYPTDVKKRAHVDRALYFDGCGLYPSFGAVVYPIVRDGAQFNPQSAQPLYQKLEVLDQLLSTQEYVAGDQLTVGDLSTVATYTAIRSVSFLETSKYTNIQKWVERVAPQVKNWELVGVEQAKKFGEFIENFLKANAAKSE